MLVCAGTAQTSGHESSVGVNSIIINARKRSLRRLCFHRCLSVHGEGGVCPIAYWDTGQTPLGQTSGQQAGGTHPTGMHSCSRIALTFEFRWQRSARIEAECSMRLESNQIVHFLIDTVIIHSKYPNLLNVLFCQTGKPFVSPRMLLYTSFEQKCKRLKCHDFSALAA